MSADPAPPHPARTRRGTGVNAGDLDLLGQKAEQNTSAPSNPRPAGAAAFTGMFARELDRVP
jgi:hypothetical protein